jgi:hypothetical protein
MILPRKTPIQSALQYRMHACLPLMTWPPLRAAMHARPRPTTPHHAGSSRPQTKLSATMNGRDPSEEGQGINPQWIRGHRWLTWRSGVAVWPGKVNGTAVFTNLSPQRSKGNHQCATTATAACKTFRFRDYKRARPKNNARKLLMITRCTLQSMPTANKYSLRPKINLILWFKFCLKECKFD